MKYKGFFFDLDGVAYIGPDVILTCRNFVNELVRRGIKVGFLTNNSSRTPQMVADHLIELGYEISAENVITSSQVTANYVNDLPSKRAYVVGMKGIRDALTEVGAEIVERDADIVVIGLDFEITYEKLMRAGQEVLNGATFIATNRDPKLLTKDGIGPGNGSIVKLVEHFTGVEPIDMGKPGSQIFEYGLQRMGLTKDEVVMVGDYYYTDILGAQNFGIDSIFVETGVMTREEVLSLSNQPTYIVKDLSNFPLDD